MQKKKIFIHYKLKGLHLTITMKKEKLQVLKEREGWYHLSPYPPSPPLSLSPPRFPSPRPRLPLLEQINIDAHASVVDVKV